MSPGPRVPRLRSALFVPGHRRDFLAKLAGGEADAAILDLEDAVPDPEKESARREVARWLGARAPESRPAACVRINPLARGSLEEDLAAALVPGLLAVLVPKLAGPEDVLHVEAALARQEARAGIEAGRIRIWPIVETAAAVRAAFEIATASTRIAYMGGSAGADGDLARELGFRWSASFEETLYVRSKVLVDVRAAGVPNPMTGVVTNLRELSEVEAFARQSRGLGYAGMMLIHPSHVPIANAAFGASPEELASARRLVAALESAERAGAGAIEHEGRMVDAAMLRVARELLAEAGAPEGKGSGR